MSRRSRAGKPHKRAWRRAKGQKNQCCYCRDSFSNRNPPTFDHIVPLSVDHLSSRTVVACVLCNNARGNADYEMYSAAVEAEHVAARAEHRRYRRPRLYARTVRSAPRRGAREWNGPMVERAIESGTSVGEEPDCNSGALKRDAGSIPAPDTMILRARVDTRTHKESESG